MPDGYNRQERPSENDTLNVRVGFYIKDLYDLSSSDMQYNLRFYYYLSWTDTRLISAYLLSYTTRMDITHLRNDIFTPDAFIKNSKVWCN